MATFGPWLPWHRHREKHLKKKTFKTFLVGVKSPSTESTLEVFDADLVASDKVLQLHDGKVTSLSLLYS